MVDHDKRLRITHLLATPDGKPGGLERHVLDLCMELSYRHEVHLLADPGFAASCDESVHFHPIKFSRSRWNPLIYHEIYRELRRINPQVIHAQAGKSATLAGRLRSLFPESVFIGTQHGYQKNIRPYLAMDTVIAVSATLAERYPPHLVKVVYNGLKPKEKLSQEDCQKLRDTFLSKNTNLVIAIGRLDPIKGFDILLKAISGLPCHLLLVGDGPERSNLEKQIQSSGMTSQVSLTGWRQDVPHLLQASDLCVISSRSEGFPLVMVEALQAGTPLVGTNISGVREILPPELLAPVEDANSLRRILQTALADTDTLQAMLAPAFARAASELTLDGMATRTELIYRELLARKNTPPRPVPAT